MTVLIRPMVESDALRLAEVCVETGLHSWSEASFIDEAHNPLAHYFVLEIDERIQGFAGIWCVVDEAQVMNIGVVSDFQHCGYGQKLMKTIMDQGRQAGCSVMTLEVKARNVPALSLYKRLGFQQVGYRKDYYPDHTDGILMSLNL